VVRGGGVYAPPLFSKPQMKGACKMYWGILIWAVVFGAAIFFDKEINVASLLVVLFFLLGFLLGGFLPQ
jgi:hypothetical protein